MCEPVTLSALAITAASAAVSAYGQYSAGRSASAQARYNQKLSNIASADAERRGWLEEQAVRRRYSQIAGAQMAAVGASGATTGVGSAFALEESSAVWAELDALTVRNNAAREGWGYAAQATSYGFEANVASQQGALGAFNELAQGTIRGMSVWHTRPRGGTPGFNSQALRESPPQSVRF